MIITATSNASNDVDPRPHVLVLTNRNNTMVGIWGPYKNNQHALAAMTELESWPIEGTWAIYPLKSFPGPGSQGHPIKPSPASWNQNMR